MTRITLIAVITASTILAARKPAPKPNVPVPTTFRNQPADAEGEAVEQWWKAFGDPQLDELIARAERANLDVRKAASRLAEAEAIRGGSRSALIPEIGSSTSLGNLRGGLNQGVIKATGAPGGSQGGSFVSAFETSVISSGFTMRWEADVFGGLRNALRASTADAQAAVVNIRDVRSIVRAEVARNYIEMRAAEDQMDIAQANIASEKDLLDLIRARADAGLASDLDLQRQVAQLASVRATLADFDTLRLLAAHRVSVLTGEDPAALLDQLAASRKPLDIPAVPTAIPSELLKRRPDIRRAEAQITAAFARVGAARADLYPKFVFTGLSGRQATDFSGLTVGAGNFFSVGPGISLPIFNLGRVRSQIGVRGAQLEQALRSYEHDVLSAFEETENAFVQRDRAAQKSHELEVGLTAARRSVELAQELYVRGLSDFLTVLDAQRSQFQMERELAASRASILRSSIALSKALGN